MKSKRFDAIMQKSRVSFQSSAFDKNIKLQHIAGDETLDVKILYVVRDQIFYLSVINFTFL